MSTPDTYFQTLNKNPWLTRLEAKLYDMVLRDSSYEYRSSAFWQILLQRLYPLKDDYGVVCEQPPVKDTLRRVDIAVLKFHAGNTSLLSTLFIETKGRDGNMSEADRQVNNAADEALKNTNLKFVYVMATRGIQFKFLKYTITNRRDGTLKCENVSDSPTDRNGYITLDGNGYAVLKYCVEKTYITPPTRDTAILPSQPLANNQFYSSQGATSGLSASQRLTGYPSAGSSSSAANRRPDTLDPNYDPRGSSRRDRRDDYATERPAARGSSRSPSGRDRRDDYETERPAARGSSRSSSGRESSSLTFHDVSNSVQRTSGSRGAPVRIYFTDRSGNVRETSESEWRMRTSQGSDPVYVYEGSGTAYWCRSLDGPARYR